MQITLSSNTSLTCNVFGWPGPAAPRNWAAEGDSITAPTAAGGGYADMSNALATPAFARYTNKAVSGSKIADLEFRKSQVDSLFQAGERNILAVMLGRNDLDNTVDVPTFLSDFRNYLDARRAVGWRILLCTLLPATNPTFTARRADANPELRLWTTSGSLFPGKHADYLCDFAADPTMGPDAAAANTSLYGDGTHPTLAGQQALRDIFRPIIVAAAA